MSTLPLDGAIKRLQENDQRLNIFANGTDSESYQAASGSLVPSIRKFLKEKDIEINEGVDSILMQVNSARDIAEASAIAADISADAAANDAATVLAQIDTVTGVGGSALVGYKHPSLQAVESNVYDKLRHSVTPQDFMTDAERADVEAGTLTLNVAPAFVKMFAAGRDCFVPNLPGMKYLIGATVMVPTGVRMVSNGAVIVLANGVNNHVFRIANGADNVRIMGLRIDGNKANNTGGNGISTGPCTNIAIKDNYIFNTSANGIFLNGASSVGFDISGNNVTGCGLAGITASDGVNHFVFSNNRTWLNNTHGIGLIGAATNGAIVGNASWDNGQGIEVADNITGYNTGIDNVVVSGNVTRGGLNNGIHMGGQRITLVGNIAYGATQYGIVMRPDTGVGDDCIMSGNIAYSNGVSGFWIENCNSGSVSGNVSRNNVGNGYAIDACIGVSFTGNAARSNGQDGFRNGTASQYLTFTGNTSRANAGDGIELANVTDSVVVGNILVENTGFGINRSGTEARNIISNNKIRSNIAGQIPTTFPSTTRINDNDTNTTRQVPSAAALTLPADGEYFYITGTTSITSITASFAGRRVTMEFNDPLTVTDGSNLSLAGNFVAAFKGALTLICDGTKWIECSRSVN